MAENAANFTKLHQIKPSILELIAQKSLDDTLYPAFKKICQFLADSFPEQFGWLNLFNGEIFCVLKGILELYYLKHFDASFSENFYGLKRILENGHKLHTHHKNLSLIFIIILPYLKKKIDEKKYIIKLEQAEGLIQKSITDYCKILLIYTHSIIETVWSLFTICHLFSYMSNQTDFQTPLFKLQGIRLIYNMESEKVNLWQAFSTGEIGVSAFFMDMVTKTLRTSLEIGAFFLQFLHTWNLTKFNYDMRDLPQVPAPMLDNKSINFQNKCPICYKFWITPTVLQVSGYIFCFRCILKYLNEHQKCPVTNLPATTLDIVRLFTS